MENKKENLTSEKLSKLAPDLGGEIFIKPEESKLFKSEFVKKIISGAIISSDQVTRDEAKHFLCSISDHIKNQNWLGLVVDYFINPGRDWKI